MLSLTSLTAGSAKGKATVAAPLSEARQRLEAQYADQLKVLQAEISKAIPTITQTNEAAQVTWAKAQSNELAGATVILATLEPFLSSDQLDAKLVKCAVLADATPGGLAEFAQQGADYEELAGKLLADDVLMKQMLEAGGAKGARYGQAMKIYTDIQKASPRAKEGILQRLALGTSLEMTVPFQQGYGSFLNSTTKPVDPVKRYLNYEQAFLAGELDSAFKGLTAWECRFVSNDPSSDEEIVWMREMLRNYRPDHVVNPDYKWRYANIVKSDVGYGGHGKWDLAAPILPMQQVMARGGICHIRAWAGRLALRAFGIPAWGVEQSGHTAVSHWTPDGWVINFGAAWPHNYFDGRRGPDFLLETQAREYPKDYLKVLRAEWVGTALGETNYNNNIYYYKVIKPPLDGWWNVLALCQKKAIVAAAKPAELAAVGTDIGEANDAKVKEASETVTVSDEDRTMVVAPDGVITIPAVACSTPISSTNKIVFLKSIAGGMQLHCNRGSQSETLEYTVDVPQAATYALRARVVTISPAQHLLVAANDAKEPVDIVVPYTLGKWDHTLPVEVMLVKGKNVLRFTRNEPVKGLAVKDFTLTPVK